VRAAKAATKALPTIVRPTSEKLLKRLQAERAPAGRCRAQPEIDAFFARNVRPGAPLPSER
jgi:hypothetical protein